MRLFLSIDQFKSATVVRDATSYSIQQRKMLRRLPCLPRLLPLNQQPVDSPQGVAGSRKRLKTRTELSKRRQPSRFLRRHRSQRARRARSKTAMTTTGPRLSWWRISARSPRMGSPARCGSPSKTVPATSRIFPCTACCRRQVSVGPGRQRSRSCLRSCGKTCPHAGSDTRRGRKLRLLRPPHHRVLRDIRPHRPPL